MERLHHATRLERDAIGRTLRAACEAEPRVLFAYLHGSFVDLPAFHDVDVAILAAGDAANGADLAVDLSTRLSRATGVPVDVRSLNDAPLSFRFRAFQGRLLACRDEARLVEMLEETTRRYLDIEPILRIATREAFAG